MALAETDCTRQSMGRSVQEGHNTKLSRRMTPQNLKSSQNQTWMSPHQNQREKAEEKHPERSRSQNATTTNNNTKPGPFQDYQNFTKQNILEKLATMNAANLYLHLSL